MKLIQCITAYLALAQLMRTEWDFAAAHSLLLLKRALQPHVDFYRQEEWKLVERYGKKNEKGMVPLEKNGQFPFEKTEYAQLFRAEKNKLNAVAVEGLGVYTIHAPKKIKPALLEAMCGLIRFEGGIQDGTSAESTV